ncbi:hypothetical protein IAU60_001861 [Kwoniella sp. DSM 27419]
MIATPLAGLLAAGLGLALSHQGVAGQGVKYPLSESHSGVSFFDGFRYPVEAYDNTTNGDVFWATPENISLMYVNEAGRVVLKVDNTTVVPYNDKRYAPKLLSKTAYGPGTVWVMDAVHVPYGCSVWGAFWSQGPSWPAGGEIDIFEGIHMRKQNMMALHTQGSIAQCKIDTSQQMTGRIESPDCDQAVNSGSGCTVFDQDETSYGEAFAGAGGGVFVTEWSTDAIRMWHMKRSDIPSTLTLTAETLDTSTLGTPVAEYSASMCDISKLFEPINIALCGDFAGIPALLEQTCPALQGDKTCYTTYVINDASTTYANAYFELNYINVYTSNPGGNAKGGNGTTPDGTGEASTTVTVGGGKSTAGVNSTVVGQGSGAGARMLEYFWFSLGIILAYSSRPPQLSELTEARETSPRMDESLLPKLQRRTLALVRQASKPGNELDAGTFTIAYARARLEEVMGLDEGGLGGQWKGVVRDMVREALETVEEDDIAEEGAVEESSRHSHSTPDPTSRSRRKRTNASTDEPSMRTARRKSPQKPRQPDSSEVDEESVFDDASSNAGSSESSSGPPAKGRKRASNDTKPVTANKSKQAVSPAGSDSGVDEQEETTSDDEEEEEVEVVDIEESPDNRPADPGAESDMSSVYDVFPSRPKSGPRKPAEKRKNAKGKKRAESVASSDQEVRSKGSKRKKKDPNEGVSDSIAMIFALAYRGNALQLSPDEAKVADLKRIVVACGVRKQWGKEFADCPTVSSQLSHLRALLTSLSMKGTPTMGKARALREKRELAQELDDVKTFEATRGLSSDRRKRTIRSEISSKRSRTTTVDSDEGSEEPKEQSALGAVLDFLGADSGSE